MALGLLGVIFNRVVAPTYRWTLREAHNKALGFGAGGWCLTGRSVDAQKAKIPAPKSGVQFTSARGGFRRFSFAVVREAPWPRTFEPPKSRSRKTRRCCKRYVLSAGGKLSGNSPQTPLRVESEFPVSGLDLGVLALVAPLAFIIAVVLTAQRPGIAVARKGVCVYQ